MTQKTHPSAPARPNAQNLSRRAHLHEANLKLARTRRLRRWLAAGIAVVLVVVVGYALWSARPTSSDGATSADTYAKAPDFTLTTTAGKSITLSSLRGHPVLLYFSEGAGCGACSQQMTAIEQNPGFAAAGVTVLPIVMNTAEQIIPDLEAYGVKTPFLLDDGKVSKAYGVLGKGMHAGLPGHGFVLVDAAGNQRWQAEYPSMWIDPKDLLKEVKARLAA